MSLCCSGHIFELLREKNRAHLHTENLPEYFSRKRRGFVMNGKSILWIAIVLAVVFCCLAPASAQVRIGIGIGVPVYGHPHPYYHHNYYPRPYYPYPYPYGIYDAPPPRVYVQPVPVYVQPASPSVPLPNPTYTPPQSPELTAPQPYLPPQSAPQPGSPGLQYRRKATTGVQSGTSSNNLSGNTTYRKAAPMPPPEANPPVEESTPQPRLEGPKLPSGTQF
jgi:hypothetical protein